MLKCKKYRPFISYELDGAISEKQTNSGVDDHGCSNHLNLEMEAECLMKNVPYLNLRISRTKNGINKL